VPPELVVHLELYHTVHRAELIVVLFQRGEGRPWRDPFVLPTTSSSSSTPMVLSVTDADRRCRQTGILGKRVVAVGEERDATVTMMVIGRRTIRRRKYVIMVALWWLIELLWILLL
jgi:hypothetical protein